MLPYNQNPYMKFPFHIFISMLRNCYLCYCPDQQKNKCIAMANNVNMSKK